MKKIFWIFPQRNVSIEKLWWISLQLTYLALNLGLIKVDLTEKDLKMTRGSINSVPSVNGGDLDETEDGLSEITSKKNRERFAINKSYSIEVILRLLFP